MTLPTLLEPFNLIFQWLIPYQNGGILNLLFKPQQSVRSNLTFEIDFDVMKAKKYFFAILTGNVKHFSFDTLQSMPASLTGDNNGTKLAHLHPTREWFFSLMPAACLAFMLLLCASLIIIGCVFLKQKQKRYANKRGSSKIINYLQKYQNYKYIHICSFGIYAGFLCVLIVAILFYLASSRLFVQVFDTTVYNPDKVIDWLNDDQLSMSIPNVIQFSGENIKHFMKEGIGNAKTSLVNTINNLNLFISETIETEMSTIYSTWMIDLMNASMNALQILTSIKEKFVYINSPESLILKRKCFEAKNRTIGSIGAKQLELSREAYTGMYDEIPVQKGLQIIYHLTNKISELVNSSDHTLTALDVFNSEVKQGFLDSFNPSTHFDPIVNYLNELRKSNLFIENNVDFYTQKSKTIFKYLFSGSLWIVSILGFATICTATIFTIYFTYFIQAVYSYNLFTLSTDNTNKDELNSKSQACTGCGFCCFSTALIVFALLIGLSVIVFLLINSILAAQVCPYLVDEAGVKKTDFVLNSFIRPIWKSMLSLVSVDNFLGNEISKITPPKNVITAIEFNCNPRKSNLSINGLLYKMGITDPIDFISILNRQQIREAIDNLKRNATEVIVESPVYHNLPTISKIENIINELEKIQNEILVIEKMKPANYCDVDSEVSINLEKLTAHANEYEVLIKCYSLLNDAGKSLNYFKHWMNILRQFYLHPAAPGELSERVSRNFDDAIQSMLNKFGVEGNRCFKKLMLEFIPCHNLYYAARSLLQSVCTVNGLNGRFFGWSLNVMIIIFFSLLLLVSLFNLWMLQTV